MYEPTTSCGQVGLILHQIYYKYWDIKQMVYL